MGFLLTKIKLKFRLLKPQILCYNIFIKSGEPYMFTYLKKFKVFKPNEVRRAENLTSNLRTTLLDKQVLLHKKLDSPERAEFSKAQKELKENPKARVRTYYQKRRAKENGYDPRIELVYIVDILTVEPTQEAGVISYEEVWKQKEKFLDADKADAFAKLYIESKGFAVTKIVKEYS